MNKPQIPLRISIRKSKRTPPGAAPGSISYSADAQQTKLSIVSFDQDQLLEIPVIDLNDVRKRMSDHPNKVHWIEVRGFGNRALFEELCQDFNLHRLEMEDVVNTYQRPKLEEHPGHLFVVSRVLTRDGDGNLHNDQVSLFVGANYVITLFEHYNDCFEPVRSRIRSGKGNLRSMGSGYLMYALLDAIVDTYFPLLENIGDRLDELEDELFNTKPRRELLHRVQAHKRELIVFRRTIFAERDKVNDLLRTHTAFIDDQTRLYLRDTYDHCIQVMDLVESYKEIIASMMDIYLSSVSNRMNQIMKVLAVISTIFIPLTFIVGLYGMNFASVDKEGNPLPMNMPELHSPYGYLGVWIFMVVLVLIQLLVFWRKGWLEKT